MCYNNNHTVHMYKVYDALTTHIDNYEMLQPCSRPKMHDGRYEFLMQSS